VSGTGTIMAKYHYLLFALVVLTAVAIPAASEYNISVRNFLSIGDPELLLRD
jgi:hypothetical protein